MNNYQCNVCSHVYVAEQGDPLHGVAAGTPFEELSNDWLCPICGVGKDSFEIVVESLEPEEMSVNS